MQYRLKIFSIKGRKSTMKKKVKPIRTNSSGSAPLKDLSEEIVIDIEEENGASEEFVIDIDGENTVSEEKLVPGPDCCIYKVPRRLREQKEKAYTPQLVSIGPFHYSNKKLADMRKQKVRYYNRFRKRINESDHEKMKTFVKENKERIRSCYAGESDLSSEEFTGMILYDAIFIIELFLRNYEERFACDFLLRQLWLKEAIKLDLQLLENQLPFFVLDELYKIAFGTPPGEVSLLSLCRSFLGFDISDDMFYRLSQGITTCKHFVDLRRKCMVEFCPAVVRVKSKGDLPSAVKLNESGVKFKAISTTEGARGLLDIKFQPRKRSKCIQRLKRKVADELQIPRIVIEDSTECLIRNMMALEQCHYPSETHLCNYVDLIDCLINTKEDVDLLVEKEIISNRVGDHKAISKMFNGLCLEIRLSESCYQGIRNDLKTFHDKWWNRTKATLVSVYFKDVWRGTATVAATILLMLTVLQTMQRLWGGWTPH